MKKLEELGISPAPWKSCSGGELVGSHGFSLMDGDGCFFKAKDARIASASPDMYNALWHLCFGQIKVVNCRTCICEDLGECKNCHLLKARSALAKAAGEEATDGTKH